MLKLQHVEVACVNSIALVSQRLAKHLLHLISDDSSNHSCNLFWTAVLILSSHVLSLAFFSSLLGVFMDAVTGCLWAERSQFLLLKQTHWEQLFRWIPWCLQLSGFFHVGKHYLSQKSLWIIQRCRVTLFHLGLPDSETLSFIYVPNLHTHIWPEKETVSA